VPDRLVAFPYQAYSNDDLCRFADFFDKAGSIHGAVSPGHRDQVDVVPEGTMHC
jgi:hypothetical protein